MSIVSTNTGVTYRVQLHKDFNFNSLLQIIPYLKRLGIKTIYAAPIFSAVPGSQHGYDGIDPLTINPEIGSLEQFREFSGVLRQNDMMWLQDFVPNHMAFHPANYWLADVLEKGRQSVYASYFDIDWNHSVYNSKLLVPFLGNDLDEAIVQKQLQLVTAADYLHLEFAGNKWPVNIFSIAWLINSYRDHFPGTITDWINHVLSLQQHIEGENISTQYDELKSSLKEWFADQHFASAIAFLLKSVNENNALLKSFINQQHYLPAYWGTADTHINYRRFFTVNGLICMNMQHEYVFDAYHCFLKQLCDEGLVNGIRIDHIDGLYNPGEYLSRLRELVGKDQYIVVEKILELHETLPGDWPVQGTTGYDFLATVNNLLTAMKAGRQFQSFYKKLTDQGRNENLVFEKKRLILEQHMQGELENLVHYFYQLGLLQEENSQDEIIRNAIVLFLVHCPVYRFYFNDFPLSEASKSSVQEVLDNILENHPDAVKEVDLLQNLFVDPQQHADEKFYKKITAFFTRCMQFTGPLMAKGIEDTLMYNYFNFLSHNEVGGSPFQFGIGIPEFHQLQKQRLAEWPMTMNATDTHDTKRGEDARARAQVLAQHPESWFKEVNSWFSDNKKLSLSYNIHKNDEYFLYQVIMAHYPLDDSGLQNFLTRLGAYLVKALREGKMHSDWAKPDEHYEKSLVEFAEKLLKPDSKFLKKFKPYIKSIIDAGLLVSLNQLILKFTCPGIPDIYQGCENWNFSFVDPDNRTPIAYDKFEKLLNDEEHKIFKFGRLWKNRANGQIKISLTRLLCRLRQQFAEILLKGNYEPVLVSGKLASEVIAFKRQYLNEWILVVMPLHSLQVVDNLDKSFEKLFSKTFLEFPFPVQRGVNLVSGKRISGNNEVSLNTLLEDQPFGIFYGKAHDPVRKAGLLLHITSLPSAYGIGDLGTEAYKFADFLSNAGQRLWQVLPVNPVSKAQGYSPYSSSGSQAGNILMISPELLYNDKLLSREDLEQYIMEPGSMVDFDTAEMNKNQLLRIAWNNYTGLQPKELVNEFNQFCREQRGWLTDFTLFSLIKKLQDQKPWNEWPAELKFRNKSSLKKLGNDHEQDLQQTAWQQFIFMKQWRALKNYCNDLDIKLFGDLPFYVGYDSADVWAHRELFKLDRKGNMLFVAGVPPDLFSNDGQLWGMPVFDWKVMGQTGFEWWADRLKRNLDMFDVVRLDHFRAFEAYWEIPASATTAVSGKWEKGPGRKFFTVMKRCIGELPFIAEDLGDIDEPVYSLRDQFYLPGMKVLQFAFGNEMPISNFIPHNYEKNFVAYTGTHDNNTLTGWLQEGDPSIREQVNNYFDVEMNEHNAFNVMGKALYMSAANEVVFPLQDVLGLGAEARMNAPSTATGNWRWRLLPGQITKNQEALLKKWTALYNR